MCYWPLQIYLGKQGMVPAKLLEILKIAQRYPFPITAYSDSQGSGMPDGETTWLGGKGKVLTRSRGSHTWLDPPFWVLSLGPSRGLSVHGGLLDQVGGTWGLKSSPVQHVLKNYGISEWHCIMYNRFTFKLFSQISFPHNLSFSNFNAQVTFMKTRRIGSRSWRLSTCNRMLKCYSLGIIKGLK